MVVAEEGRRRLFIFFWVVVTLLRLFCDFGSLLPPVEVRLSMAFTLDIRFLRLSESQSASLSLLR